MAAEALFPNPGNACHSSKTLQQVRAVGRLMISASIQRTQFCPLQLHTGRLRHLVMVAGVLMAAMVQGFTPAGAAEILLAPLLYARTSGCCIRPPPPDCCSTVKLGSAREFACSVPLGQYRPGSLRGRALVAPWKRYGSHHGKSPVCFKTYCGCGIHQEASNSSNAVRGP